MKRVVQRALHMDAATVCVRESLMATVGNELLDEFNDAWKKKTPTARAHAKKIAETWVAANQDFLFSFLGDKTRAELVRMVEGYRHIGDDADRTAVDCWLLTHHAPVPVTGVARIDPAAVTRAAAEALIRDVKLVSDK